MKPGDFIDVHFEHSCLVGKMLSDDGDTITVEFDNGIIEGIPKKICTLWIAVKDNNCN